jgi:hypothetical protein
MRAALSGAASRLLDADQDSHLPLALTEAMARKLSQDGMIQINERKFMLEK